MPLPLSTSDIEITSSPSASAMPRTPVEARLWNTRTVATGKRMARPWRVASSTSCSSLQTLTPISRSPASSPSNFMAILPVWLTLTKSLSSLRRTPPRAVANITWSVAQLASSSGIGMTALIVSPSLSGSRLTKALPRACGVPNGRRQTLSL